MTTNITKRVAEVERILDDKVLAREAYRVFREHTPIGKTKNAYNSTVLKDTTIEAQYPYAKRLDEGYSKKKPDGMSKPTLQFISKWIKQKLG
jgi:hypothetical protein